MAEEKDEFAIETADAGAALWQGVEAGSIRKGGYIMIKGKACKVKDVSTSKTGKHGHAKCKFSAQCIFTGATCEELCPSSHNIDQPFVKMLITPSWGSRAPTPSSWTRTVRCARTCSSLMWSTAPKRIRKFPK